MPRASSTSPRAKPYARTTKKITYNEDVKVELSGSEDEAANENDEGGNAEQQSGSEFVDTKPDIGSDSAEDRKKTKGKGGKGKWKAAAKGTATPKKNAAKGSVAGKWTPDEDWILFTHLHPKVAKPDWAGIAAAIGGGRDGKSCQNRYYQWDKNKKLEAAIKNMG